MNSGYLKENIPFSLHISISHCIIIFGAHCTIFAGCTPTSLSVTTGNPSPCHPELAEKSKTFGISK